MEDKKLKQQCRVVLEDCFRGCGAMLHDDNEIYEQIEPLSNAVSSLELPENCLSKSFKLKPLGRKEKTAGGVNVMTIRKSPFKSANKLKVVPTTKTSVSLKSAAAPWRQHTKSFSSLMSLIQSETTSEITPATTHKDEESFRQQTHQPAKRVTEAKQTEQKSNCSMPIARDAMSLDVDDGQSPATSDNFICNLKDGIPHEPSKSTDLLILEPEDGKFNPAFPSDKIILTPKDGKLSKSDRANNDLILDQKVRKLSKSGTSTNNLRLTSISDLILESEDGNRSKPVVSDNVSVLHPEGGTMNKTTPSAEQLILNPNDGKLYTNPKCKMPMVGLTVEAGIGHQLPSLPAKCVLTCLDKCKNSITPEYAEFSAAVVKTSSKPAKERIILPIKDNQVLELMQVKWNSKSSVKQVSFSSCVPAPTSTAKQTKLKNNYHIHQNSGIKTTVGNQIPHCSKRKTIKEKNRPVMLSKSDSKSGSKCGSSLKQIKMSLLDDDKKKVSPLQMYVLGQDTSLSLDCTRTHSTDPKDSDDDQILEVTNKSVMAVSDPHDTRGIKKSEEKADVKFSEWRSSLKRKMSLLDNDKKKGLPLEICASGQDISSSLDCSTIPSTDHMDSDDDKMLKVTKKTAFEVSEPNYDPDDARGIDQSEDIAVEPKKVIRTRTSQHKLMHELRRLNVAVIDMPTSPETVVCKTPDICRLGCICSSLLCVVVRDNCGLEKCMFGCICLKTQHFDRGSQSYTWVQNKAKENLAKEERNFKQTVVRSGKDDLILVEGRRKREIKMPKKYSEDFLSSADLRQTKSMREFFHDEEIPNNVPSLAKQVKRVKSGSNELSGKVPSPLPIVDKENSVNTARYSVDKSSPAGPVYSNFISSAARTSFYDYRLTEAYQARQKQIEMKRTVVEIDEEPELCRIASTQSLDQKDWEYPDSEDTVNAMDVLKSCSLLYDTEYLKENSSEAKILPGEVLEKEIFRKAVFVWYQPNLAKLTSQSSALLKPKIYLTNCPSKPCTGCLDFQLFDEKSEIFSSLPTKLKALKIDYSTGLTNDVGWILRKIKSFWMITGHIQMKQPSKKLEEFVHTGEVDILPSLNEDYLSRWWVMDLSQNFDLIYFMDFKKALTKRQMNTLLRLSHECPQVKSKVHRILLNRQRPKLNANPVSCPDFGAYSVSNHPNKVFIGPYHSFKEPKFQVYSQKSAPNGKTQYIGVPLFYCGVHECVRVTSQGVLSLHSESLPDVYVRGFWYQSYGNNLSESYEKPLLTDSLDHQELGSHSGALKKATQSSIHEILTVTGNEDKSSAESHDNCDNGRKFETMCSDAESDFNFMENVDEDNESSLDVTDEEQGTVKLQSRLPLAHTGNETTQSQQSSENTLVSSLLTDDSSSSISSRGSCGSYNSNHDCDDSHIQSATEKEELTLEYMIPDEPKIGYVILKHLPGGAMSVPHFTEKDSLKFYHFKFEIIKDLNRLIHQKLSCLSRKCAVFLQNDDICECVQWSFSKNKPNPDSMLKFTPAIFNGFYMLTNYGLLDIRSTQESIIQELGKDWVDWMKNDQIRLKLEHWKSQEEQEVLEAKLKTILSSNKDLPLLEVLSMATSEIAKLKAEDQLLEYESQAQKLLRETLISSLCRKLDGIPVDIVPKFLDHLEFSLLWEVLECMNDRNTMSILLEKPETPHPKPLSATNECHVKNSAAPDVTKVKRKGVESKKVKVNEVSKAVHNPETLSTSRKALLYMERLREEIRQEEEEKLNLRKKMQVTQQQKSQFPPQLQKSGKNRSLLKVVHNQAATLESGHSFKTANDKLQVKDGVACSMSPFSRINICVEEGGIKYSPISSPSKRSPEKPSILRKSKGPVGSVFAVASQAQKQARKQIFPNKQQEEPLYLEDPVISTPNPIGSPLSNDFDPISSLCIVSVASEAKSATSPLQDNNQLSLSEINPVVDSSLGQVSENTSAINCMEAEPFDNPVSSLRIANVFSTRDDSADFPHTNNFPPVSPLTDPVSSLRISSVRSGAFACMSPVRSSGSKTSALLDNPTISVKSNPGPISVPTEGSSQIAGRVVSKPTFDSTFLCSKKDGRQVLKIVPKISKVRASDKRFKTIHVLKNRGYVSFDPKVEMPTLHSILTKSTESLQFSKKQDSINEASAPEDESSK